MRIRSYGFLCVAAALLCHCAHHPASEEIQFTNGDVTLSGDLILPEGDGPFPAVVFVHGSGPETRDNSSYSAEWLASIGYGALIYDKRGAGRSGGDEREISYFDFNDLAGDVIAAVEFLANRPEIDARRIGLHASSQGGWVAPLAASRSDLIRFMIVRSPSVVTVGADRIFERGARLKKEGFTDSEIAESREMQLVEGKSREGDDAEFRGLFAARRSANWFPRVYGKTEEAADLDEYREWYATVADFDPIPLLESIEIPVIWIFGDPSLDNSGPVSASIGNLERLKRKGKDYTILQYDGEGHNISESKYERALFDWLGRVNRYDRYEFKKH